jgi:hypothetical protein
MNQRVTEQVFTRVDAATYKRLQQIAAREDRSVASVVRRIILASLQKKGSK